MDAKKTKGKETRTGTRKAVNIATQEVVYVHEMTLSWPRTARGSLETRPERTTLRLAAGNEALVSGDDGTWVTASTKRRYRLL